MSPSSTNACKVFLYLVIQLGLNSLTAQLAAPPATIRIQSEYFLGTNSLKCKYEYYYHAWSEQKVRHGRFSAWDTKGRLRQKATYLHGKLDGIVLYYNKRGKVVKQVTYLLGGKVSAFRPKKGGQKS